MKNGLPAVSALKTYGLMKSKLLTIAAALALLGALGHFGTKPLFAQIRAALVKNIDERGRTPYMAPFDCGAFGVTSHCTRSGPAVPANKRFVVEYISGRFTAQSIAQFSNGFLEIPVPGLSPLNVGLVTHLESTVNGSDNYSVSMPVVLYYDAGQAPVVVLFTAHTAQFAVAGNFILSGYLVDLTQ